tara:strand:+ start:8707 stop:9558 length:852 start_codon:yes stop_codon:yes gene_type:complete
MISLTKTNKVNRLERMSKMAKILMKWGGGLITDKGKLMSPKIQRMKKLSKMVKQLDDLGHSIIIVHGAGSFGHLKAKKWRLKEGRIESIRNDQVKAVEEVRNDMRKLNQLVVNELEILDMTTISHPPSNWAKGTGPEFTGSISEFRSNDESLITITFGDVVNCDNPKDFGILSGDDIMVRLAKEIEDITHVIFLLGDAEGLLSSPPEDPDSELINLWKSGSILMGKHHSEIDVTGGIKLKVTSAEKISEDIDHVWMIDGRKPERVIELIQQGSTIGTKIVNEA